MALMPYLRLIPIFSLLSFSAAANASDLRVDGFASFVVGQVLDEDEISESGFLGYDENLDFQRESIFALQFLGDLGNNLSLTTQIIARGSQDFDTEFAWAYLSYQATRSTTISLGRSRIPYYMYSDTLEVGYAYHWINPPQSLYSIDGTFANLDGITIDHLTSIQRWSSRMTFMFGNNRSELSSNDGSLEASLDNFWIAAWSLNRRWFTVRLSYSEFEASLDFYNLVVDTLTTAPFAINLTDEQVNQLTIDNDRAKFAGLSIALDPGDWFAVAEFSSNQVEDSPLLEDNQGWYITGGIRLGRWTYHATYSEYTSDVGEDTQTIVNNIIAPGLGSGTPADFGYGNEILIDTDNQTYRAGLRYDFHPAAAFKAEYLETKIDAQDQSPQLLRLGVDITF